MVAEMGADAEFDGSYDFCVTVLSSSISLKAWQLVDPNDDTEYGDSKHYLTAPPTTSVSCVSSRRMFLCASLRVKKIFLI